MSAKEPESGTRRAVIAGDAEAVETCVRESLAAGIGPREIIDDALVPAMDEVGRLFLADELFLPEMMQSAVAFERAMSLLEPALEASGQSVVKAGVVVLGTVRGDIHSIGKNILGLLLRIAGFSVHDLGVDVAPFDFVSKAEEVDADIIACSALLTTTLSGQKDVIDVLAGSGKRGAYKVIVGGGATTAEWAEAIGADGFSATAYEAVEMAKQLFRPKTQAGGR